MSASPDFRLPALLRTWLASPDTASVHGFVKFLLPGGREDAQTLRALRDERWPGMHPELLPFAITADMDLLCLVARPGEPDLETAPVARFSPELYTAVPIASSLRGLLFWLELDAWRRRKTDATFVRAERSAADVMERLFRAAGLSRSNVPPAGDPDDVVRALHERMLEVDPAAAGSLLVLSAVAMREERLADAAELAQRAERTFPGFASARYLQTLIAMRQRSWERTRRHLFELVRMPWVWAPDRADPLFAHVPPFEPEQVASDYLVVLGEPQLLEKDRDAVSAWVINRPRVRPREWIQASEDFAAHGDIEAGLGAASNALLRDPCSETANEAFLRLKRLYAQLGAHAHVALCSQGAALVRRFVRPSQKLQAIEGPPRSDGAPAGTKVRDTLP